MTTPTPIQFDAGPALVSLDPDTCRVTILDMPTDGLDLDEVDQLIDELLAATHWARRKTHTPA